MLYSIALAHFTLTGSREQGVWPSDNTRFWPISGGDVLRPEPDCLNLASREVVEVSGQHTFTYEIGDGASHVGLCEAFIVKEGIETKLEEKMNCVADQQAMTVDLSNESCDACVVKIKVAASHMGPDTLEHYDSCVDVKIGNGAYTEDDGAVGQTIVTGSPTIDAIEPVQEPHRPSSDPNQEPVSQEQPPKNDVSPRPHSHGPASTNMPPRRVRTDAFTCTTDGQAYIINGIVFPMALGTKCIKVNGSIMAVHLDHSVE